MGMQKIYNKFFEAGFDPTDIREREDGFQVVTRNSFTRFAKINKLYKAFADEDIEEIEIMTTADGKFVFNLVY